MAPPANTRRRSKEKSNAPTLLVAAWLSGDRQLDVDKAREIVLGLQAHAPAAPGLSEPLERGTVLLLAAPLGLADVEVE